MEFVLHFGHVIEAYYSIDWSKEYDRPWIPAEQTLMVKTRPNRCNLLQEERVFFHIFIPTRSASKTKVIARE